MKGNEIVPETEVTSAVEQILDALKDGGPQDLYQLNGDVGNIAATAQAARLLVEKALIEERNHVTPSFSNDPFTIVYGIKRGSVPGSRLKSW